MPSFLKLDNVLHRLLQRARTAPKSKPGSSNNANSKSTATATTTMVSSLDIVLQNNTDAGALYAHITGRSEQGLFMLQADGKTAYHPSSPSGTLQSPAVDCAINVGGRGQSRTITVPRISGARIWFCKGAPLKFLLNPGPALVEPSATNPADPNYDLDWGFCEFTLNEAELYVNVSYVDFVSIPISLALDTGAGARNTVPGLPTNALQAVSSALEAQGGPWTKLVVRRQGNGAPLRTLSPNSGNVLFPGLFDGYYSSYVDRVWAKYENEDLTVNTQFKWGDAVGRVSGGKLTFKSGDVGSFDKPSAGDIFSCSTGPFAAGQGISDERLNVGARLAAAFNRSTLLLNSVQPEGEKVDSYYREAVTNHYSRVCHQTSLQSRGYAFPYDDVGSSKGEDQSGFLNDPNPKLLTVSVGAPL